MSQSYQNANENWITYSELLERFGEQTTKQLLHCLERMSEIKNEIVMLDCEHRWMQAMTKLNSATHFLHSVENNTGITEQNTI